MSARTRIHKALFLAVMILSSAALEAQNKQDLKLKTVVLDAGHGGTDAGAVSKDGKTKEKDLTLAISKRVGAKIVAAYPDVKVVYTRPEDKFVTLQDRADIANRNQANLFISIHINAFTSTTPDGYSSHILGESSKKNTDLFAYNMNVCKRENSVILLEDDYTTKYQGFDPNDPESFIFFHLMQNAFYEQSLLFAADVQAEMGKNSGFTSDRGIHQDPFFVLWKTTMPSVLIENGFISNAKDLAILRTEEGIENISESIFRAFSKFKARYDGSTDFSKMTSTQNPVQLPPPARTAPKDSTVQVPPPPRAPKQEEPKPQAKEPAAEDTTVKYGIQVVVSSKVLADDDPFFCGFPATRHPAGMINKYMVYEQASEEEVRKVWPEVKKKFPDSFVVRIEGKSITIAKSK